MEVVIPILAATGLIMATKKKDENIDPVKSKMIKKEAFTNMLVWMSLSSSLIKVACSTLAHNVCYL